jgi:Ribose/xylose/arabinose/galactoside ABC-type transport systems, permease components
MLKKIQLPNSLKSNSLQKILALGALVVLYVFFSFFGHNFFSIATLVNILNSSYYIGFLAIGETFTIISGGIDLSVGTVMMCSALIGGVAYSVWHWPIAVALGLVIVIATLFGILNGIIIAKLKLPPFIATLGTMMVTMGFGAIISKVMTMRYPTVTDPDGWFKFVFYKTQGGFPIGAVWLAGFFVLASVILGKTRLGRYTFAMGSNEEATRLSGVGVDNWKIGVYAVAGLFAGLGGIVYISAYTSIIPGTGNGIELLAIAGAVIGGTSLAGGIGTLSGTLIGVYIMSILKQGLMSMNLQGQWQTFFTGVVVIGAVMLDNWRNKKASEIKKG